MLKNYVNKSKRVQKPLTKTLLAGALVLGGMSVAMEKWCWQWRRTTRIPDKI